MSAHTSCLSPMRRCLLSTGRQRRPRMCISNKRSHTMSTHQPVMQKHAPLVSLSTFSCRAAYRLESNIIGGHSCDEPFQCTPQRNTVLVTPKRCPDGRTQPQPSTLTSGKNIWVEIFEPGMAPTAPCRTQKVATECVGLRDIAQLAGAFGAFVVGHGYPNVSYHNVRRWAWIQTADTYRRGFAASTS